MTLKERFLRVFGDIKILGWPPFLYYQKGDYYKISGAESRRALELLRPGDVVLRGYDCYLDNLFIPGEFSHSGVYTGGGQIVHAVGEGVSFTDAIDFLRCDRFCILRPRKGQKEAINTVVSLIGSPYDFNFSDGDAAFYCHELVAYAYAELDIRKVTPYLGWIRFCGLAPKFLAESFLNNQNFKLIIKKGK